VRNLTKRFGHTAAVEDVSLEVPKNAFVAIVGESGCGKSTLLRLIAGLEDPDGGTIALDGVPVAGPDNFVPPEQRKVGVVFQSYALWPHLSVAGNVAFPYEAQGMRRAQAQARALDHIRAVGLEPFSDRRPETLSGGQRQRVALARALAGDARTILMDEPLANLDPHLRHAMEIELKAFHRRAGVTTFYITHDQREAMALADVMAVMDAGRILQFGTPEEIYTRPNSEKVARFIGRGAVVAGSVQDGAVQVGGRAIPGLKSGLVSGQISSLSDVGPRAGPAKVLIRPNQIAMAEDGMPAHLTSVVYRGGLWEAVAVVEGISEPLMVDLDRPAAAGDLVRLKLVGGWVLPV
jgi:iron(III) transport system ATP-binding protein